MKLNQLITVLNNHKGLELLFEYKENQFTKPSYLLTEIKNVNIKSVDCGGKFNQWKETHIQLWESPSEKDKTEYLTVKKAISIINHVDSINKLWINTDVKIEFGNDSFNTSIMDITDLKIVDNKLIFKLFSVKTQCKAIDIEEDDCCTESKNCC